MRNMKIGDNYMIHCYKHDGTIHRSWDEAVLLDVNKDFLVFGNRKAKVHNSDGRIWYTREPAIIYYYKNRWYNVITQFKKNGIYYYCNIASPTILEGKVIKYIDYDLDLRVFPDGSFKILDRGEYKYHKKIMSYPEEIDKILKEELTNLINLVRNRELAFKKGTVEYYCDLYEKQKNNNKYSN